MYKNRKNLIEKVVRDKKKNTGLATLEILIALAIVTLTISAVILVVFGGQDTVISSQTHQEALYKAQKLLEDARGKAKVDFSGIIDTSPVADDIYSKYLEVEDEDAFTKRVTSHVTWGNGLEVTLTTMVLDWQAATGGDTCSEVLSGDWSDPQPLGYYDFPSSEGATDLDILSHKAYVTSNPSSLGEDDFYIVDVSNPNLKPLPLVDTINGKISTGPGLMGIQVAGRYAYVANTSDNSQFQTIDISGPPTNPPVVIANIDITTDSSDGNSIFYTDKKVYLGLTKSTGPELNIFCVAPDVSIPVCSASSPSNPVLIGTYETDTKINSILVEKNETSGKTYAYLATPQPVAGTPEEENLSVLDVSDPTSPSRIETFTASDAALMDGRSIYFSEDDNKLYLGRTVGGVDVTTNHEFFVLDADTPSSLSIIDSINIADTVSAITIRDHLAFLLTGTPNLGFQIWDLNTMNLYSSLNIEQNSTGGMDCEGNLVFIAQRANRALQIVGANLAAPTVALAVHNDSHNTVSTVNTETPVHTEITVSGSGPTPTGEVNLTLYSSDDCSSGPASDPNSPFTLNGSGIVEPTTVWSSLPAGLYSFKASYEGDVEYNPAVSSCVPLTIIKANPTVAVTIYDSATGLPVTSVLEGTVVHVETVISGIFGTPTGTVNFLRYNKIDCAPGAHTDENNVPLVAGVAESSDFTTVNKDICYVVEYSGDANYNAIDSADTPLEVN